MITTTETRSWSIRPTTIKGHRRFLAVAKDSANGGESVAHGMLAPKTFPTVAEARKFIADRYDDGRSFPEIRAPKAFGYDAAYFASIEAIRDRHRVAY